MDVGSREVCNCRVEVARRAPLRRISAYQRVTRYVGSWRWELSTPREFLLDLLRLPEVAAIVGGNHVEGGRQTDANEADEGVAERRTVHVDRRGFGKQAADAVVRRVVGAHQLVATGDRPRRDLARRPHAPLHGKIERLDELASEEAGTGGAAPRPSGGARPIHRAAHRIRVCHVGPGQVIQAERHAPPPALVWLPEEGLVAESRGERISRCIRLVERVGEDLKVRGQLAHVVRFRDRSWPAADNAAADVPRVRLKIAETGVFRARHAVGFGTTV